MIWMCKIFGHKFSYHWICTRCGYYVGKGCSGHNPQVKQGD